MSLFEILMERAVTFIPILLSLTVHEWAHAWTAWRLGDDTARMLGRVSLNPVDHMDLLGTLLLPLLGIPFGWAKPVPINPTRFRTSISMPMGILLTAAAGPLSNLLLAGVSYSGLMAVNGLSGCAALAGVSPRLWFALTSILQTLLIVNVLLACFNLLPIPPLDGSRIADALVPNSLRPAWEQFMALGPILLAAIILLPALDSLWTSRFREEIEVAA